MITWMQRHRKKMVVIMWITVIAFVGAGFVGWGSYKYGSKSNALAMVGDISIKNSEFQNEYKRLYGYYNQLFNGKLPQDQAKQLQDLAMQRLITKAYFLNLAKDVGIDANDNEVAKKIFTMDEFKKDGKFDKKIYQKVLNNARMSIAQFEDEIKQDIILNKLLSFFDFDITDTEFQAIASSMFLADKLKIKIIDTKDLKISTPENELKEFWSKNKQKYMDLPKYDIAYWSVKIDTIKLNDDEIKKHFEKNKIKFIPLGSNKKFSDVKSEVLKDLKFKKAKKEALRKKLALKKNKLEPKIAKAVNEFNLIVPQDEMPKLSTSNYSKPLKTLNGYVVAKLIKKYNPKPLSYEKALSFVTSDLVQFKTKLILEEKAKASLKNFEGEIVGFVTQNDINKIKELSQEEASEFLGYVFNKKKDKGYVNLEKKVVLYQIMEQKLFDKKEVDKNKEFIVSNAKNIKRSLLENEIIKVLQNLYEVKKFY